MENNINSDKPNSIELILSEMEKGNIDAPFILAKIGKDWQIIVTPLTPVGMEF